MKNLCRDYLSCEMNGCKNLCSTNSPTLQRLIFYDLILFISMETLNNTEVYYSLGNEYTDYELVDKNLSLIHI